MTILHRPINKPMSYQHLKHMFALRQRGYMNRNTLIWWIDKYQRSNGYAPQLKTTREVLEDTAETIASLYFFETFL